MNVEIGNEAAQITVQFEVGYRQYRANLPSPQKGCLGGRGFGSAYEESLVHIITYK
jgi:hypothetical protein